MIRCNPIKNGVYQRKDIPVIFNNDNFTDITLKQGDNVINVDCASFFRDVLTVVQRAEREEVYVSQEANYERLWWMIGTNWANPIDLLYNMYDLVRDDLKGKPVLDKIYKLIEDKLAGGEYTTVNNYFDIVEQNPRSSVDLLLGVLTATLIHKSKLQGRKLFFKWVKKNITERGLMEEGLLEGLE